MRVCSTVVGQSLYFLFISYKMLKENLLKKSNSWERFSERMYREFVYNKLPPESAFWNTFWTDKKIKLTEKIPDNATQGWLTIWDLRHLVGSWDVLDFYIPVQCIITDLTPEEYKKLKPDTSKMDYKLKYLRVYALKQDVALAIWLPLSVYKDLKHWDISFDELDDALRIVRKKKRELKKEQREREAEEFDLSMGVSTNWKDEPEKWKY